MAKQRIKIKLSPSLYDEMSGGGFAQEDEPDLFGKLAHGAPLDLTEAKLALDGIESTLASLEAIIGGGSPTFAEAGALSGARRNAERLARDLRNFIAEEEGTA